MTTRDDTVFTLARLGVARGQVDTILRALPAIQRAHEAACMAWPEEQVEYFTKRGDAAFARLRAEADETLDTKWIFRRQCDPRGCTVEVWDRARWGQRESGEPDFRLCANGFSASEIARLDKRAEYLQNRAKYDAAPRQKAGAE